MGRCASEMLEPKWQASLPCWSLDGVKQAADLVAGWNELIVEAPWIGAKLAKHRASPFAKVVHTATPRGNVACRRRRRLTVEHVTWAID